MLHRSTTRGFMWVTGPHEGGSSEYLQRYLDIMISRHVVKYNIHYHSENIDCSTRPVVLQEERQYEAHVYSGPWKLFSDHCLMGGILLCTNLQGQLKGEFRIASWYSNYCRVNKVKKDRHSAQRTEFLCAEPFSHKKVYNSLKKAKKSIFNVMDVRDHHMLADGTCVASNQAALVQEACIISRNYSKSCAY